MLVIKISLFPFNKQYFVCLKISIKHYDVDCVCRSEETHLVDILFVSTRATRTTSWSISNSVLAARSSPQTISFHCFALGAILNRQQISASELTPGTFRNVTRCRKKFIKCQKLIYIKKFHFCLITVPNWKFQLWRKENGLINSVAIVQFSSMFCANIHWRIMFPTPGKLVSFIYRCIHF